MSLETSGSVNCYKCNTVLPFEDGQNIGRQEECHNCYANLHCCKMCQFYDTSSYNECKEPVAQRILDKEKSNFCDYFKIGKGGKGGPSKGDLMSAADALFKN